MTKFPTSTPPASPHASTNLTNGTSSRKRKIYRAANDSNIKKVRIHTIARTFDVDVVKREENLSSQQQNGATSSQNAVHESLYSFARCWFMANINARQRREKDDSEGNALEMTPVAARQRVRASEAEDAMRDEDEQRPNGGDHATETAPDGDNIPMGTPRSAEEQIRLYEYQQHLIHEAVSRQIEQHLQNEYVHVEHEPILQTRTADDDSFEKVLHANKRAHGVKAEKLRNRIVHEMRESREKRRRIERIRYEQARICFCKRLVMMEEAKAQLMQEGGVLGRD